MGVFHMAVPFPTSLGDKPFGSRPERLPRPKALAEKATRRNHTGTPAEVSTARHLQLAAPAALTTLPAFEARQHTFARTPQQDAEQEAILLLVRGCISGEQRAWHQLVTSQHRRVYGLCYRFTGDATEAEDVTQDVFLKVYRNLSSFDPAKGTFQTWITTMTRNLLVDTYRRGRMDRASDSLDVTFAGEEDGPTRAERLPDTRPGQNQERHVAGLELKAQIQHALKELSPELREAVILRDLEDMDYKEIAVVLKIPEGTVKSRISRGRSELARLLQSLEGQVM
jgi:RNA polymerase sigma-70 factor (ECF subfamily)